MLRGTLRGPALIARVLAVPLTDRDTWIDAVLGFEGLPPDVADLPAGSVPYLPCGVDEIIAMVREAPVGSHDTLVDIGSGLGRALILAHLISGVHAHGIEIQAPLVAEARARCAELGLQAITFAHANAADVQLDGSRFFLYAPCNGAMLASVVERIREVARRRTIVVATVGFELPDAGWLVPRASRSGSLAQYDAAPTG